MEMEEEGEGEGEREREREGEMNGVRERQGCGRWGGEWSGRRQRRERYDSMFRLVST